MHMPHGPGFDPWLPHDLVHFVVERHCGIAGGVFGQLAAGGDAGTFVTIPHRRRDPARRRSERLGAFGREEMARSERLAAACMAAWHARRGRRWAFAESVHPGAREAVSAELLSELERISDRWHGLQVGGTPRSSGPSIARRACGRRSQGGLGARARAGARSRRRPS